MNLDRKVGAPQFALHALDAGFRTNNLYQKGIHFQNLGGAELRADAAPFAVSFDNFDSWTAHFRYFSSARGFFFRTTSL
jgi:hypothetical protein